MDDDDETEETPDFTAVRFDPAFVAVVMAGLVGGVFDALATAAHDMETALAMHYNWRLSRKNFARAAALDMETIFTEGERDAR